MLPQSHAFVAVAVQKWLAGRDLRLKGADYRAVALAGMLPDLIDKPLAIFVLPQTKAGLLFAHAPIFHVPLWLLAWFVPALRPYVIAFTGHIVGDRIWFFHDTFWFPLRGLRFHQWKHIGDPKAFSAAYKDLFSRRPYLFLYELVALAALIWFIVSSGLADRRALVNFLRTGRVPNA
ncbi:MAG: hypothetical protein HZB53_08065 [Chloroflexi bacterium]|nr:hypothetical protein [Chloroflexota bacterium]